MKKLLATVGIAIMASAAAVQAADDGWIEDFDKARETAGKENKLILADFTGSDWCGWCIRLDREVLSREAFKEFAKKHLVLFKADFPMRSEQSEKLVKQNKALAERYRVQGFPTLLLIDEDGKELARTGYRPGGAERYVDHLKSLMEETEKSLEKNEETDAS